MWLDANSGRHREPHVALLAAGFAWIAVIWLWRPSVFAMPVDDSFYYLVTAKNVAAGLGPTFDRINFTNGFHPLWLALLSGLCSLVDWPIDALVRLVLTFQVALVYAGARLLAKVAPLGGGAVQAIVAVLLINPYVAKAMINGQESAVQFLILCAVLYAWWDAERAPQPVSSARHLFIGALSGLAVLARLEALLFASAVAAMPLVWPSPVEAGERPRRRVAAVVWRVGGVAAMVAPYLTWNLARFGHLLPVSGAIKHETGGSLPSGAILGLAALALAGLALVVVLGRRIAQGKAALPLRWVFPLVAYVTLLEAYHLAFRTLAGISTVRVWYLVPHFILAAIAVCLALAALRGGRARVAAAAGLAVAWLAGAVVAWEYRLDPRTYAVYRAEAEGGQWLRSRADPDAVIAGWDVGYFSAFSGLRVMALDGLINSWEFKERYLEGGRVEKFITTAHPVDYVAQIVRPETIRELAAEMRQGKRAQGSGAEANAATNSGPRSDRTRWTPALLKFTVVRAAEVEARFAYSPRNVVSGMFFLVLSRQPQSGRPILAQFLFERGKGPVGPAGSGSLAAVTLSDPGRSTTETASVPVLPSRARPEDGS